MCVTSPVPVPPKQGEPPRRPPICRAFPRVRGSGRGMTRDLLNSPFSGGVAAAERAKQQVRPFLARSERSSRYLGGQEVGSPCDSFYGGTGLLLRKDVAADS